LAYLGVDGKVMSLLMSVLKTGFGNVYWVHLIRIATDLYHSNEYFAPISVGHVLTGITVGTSCVTNPPLCYNYTFSPVSVY
jgi:hypothetical protein